MAKVTSYLRGASMAALLAVAAGRASAASGTPYRVIAYMPGGVTYVAPTGITEGSPGVFYVATIQPAIVSVTVQVS
jgi:hypothetical protein